MVRQLASIRPTLLSFPHLLHLTRDLDYHRCAELLNNITFNHPEPTTPLKDLPLSPELVDQKIEHSKIGRAKSFFSMREYRRAAHILSGSEHTKAVFIRNYSLFLVRKLLSRSLIRCIILAFNALNVRFQ